MARPELDRLRDDARGGRFQAVLINDVDRLARDVAHLGIIKRALEKQNVQVIFRKLPADASPVSNLMVNILGSFAEFERELIEATIARVSSEVDEMIASKQAIQRFRGKTLLKAIYGRYGAPTESRVI